MHSGRSAEAIREMERARDLDPLSLITNTLIGFAYHNARQYNRAIEEYEKVIQLDPQIIREMERARDLDPLSLITNTLIGFAYHNARQYNRAIEEYEKVIQLDP